MTEKILTLPCGSLVTDMSSITVSLSQSGQSNDHQSTSFHHGGGRKIRIEMPESMAVSMRVNLFLLIALTSCVIFMAIFLGDFSYRTRITQNQVSILSGKLETLKGVPASFKLLEAETEKLKSNLALLQKQTRSLAQEIGKKPKDFENSMMARQEKVIDVQLRISDRIQKMEAQIQRLFWFVSQQSKEMESLKRN